MVRTEWPCLAFTKTTGWEERDRPDDELSSYDRMLEWAVREGIIDHTVATGLRVLARERPQPASTVLETSRRVRHALYRTFASIARDGSPPPGALAELNEAFQGMWPWLRLSGEGRTYDWTFATAARERLEWPLWRVVRSAATLLTAEELGRLKLCDAHDCGWLFIDASRNRSRRWCDMRGCGNRAKARRFRERHGG